jgi:hypothetical protein
MPGISAGEAGTVFSGLIEVQAVRMAEPVRRAPPRKTRRFTEARFLGSSVR